MTSPTAIAYFISPHGYGHAARASAVMEAIHHLAGNIRFEIFTRVPDWFFADSLSGSFGYHPLLTDIGLVQKTSLVEDLAQTVQRLDDFLPFDPSRIQSLAQQVVDLNCRLVICDIAPLGIAVAQAANLPAVLVENFTWDWIYEGYLSTTEVSLSLANRLQEHSRYLRTWFHAVDYHVQTQPIGRPSLQADLTTGPISRPLRMTADQVRSRLGLNETVQVVMITMGGIPWHYSFLEQLQSYDNLQFIIPGSDVAEMSPEGNVRLLPYNSNFYHPDLINAVDVVIGKAGYSTVAEVYQAGVPFGYITRPNFRESEALMAYIEAEMSGLLISEKEFRNGRWLSSVLPELLAMPSLPRRQVNNADQVARFILALHVRG